jgi:glycosyltransferase involved in cell wall biosynthesis
MMKSQGYEIVHYGVEGAQTDANEHVDIMTQYEQNQFRGHDGSDPAKFYSDDCSTDLPLFKEFNKRLRVELMDRVAQNDLVLLPMGHAHHDAVGGLPFKLIESGVGYPILYNHAEFKIFESNAWRHWHQGLANRHGRNYEWVIPNYFNVEDWKFQPKPEPNTFVFLGRICELKGLSVIVEIAKRRPDLRFIICGQGNPRPYLQSKNIIYVPPIKGKMRSMMLGTATAVLMPTIFTEPFAGVSVEAQLCGTPVISSSYGAFTETIEDEVTGFRCHTLGDYLAAIDRVVHLDRKKISDRARHLYGYSRVSRMYDRAFQQIVDLGGEGWYSSRSVFQVPDLKLLTGKRAG